MKVSKDSRRAAPLPAEVRDLVRQAADSMGVSIEFWDASGRQPERVQQGPGCAACEARQPRVFDRCRKRRAYLARRDTPLAEEIAERCPQKLRLARLSPDSPGAPTIFAFGYGGEGGDAAQDARVLSFLHDLRRVAAEAPALPDYEPANRFEEINLLYSISGRLTQPDDLHGKVEQVLADWRQALDGDCAFLWLRDRTLLEMSRAPGVPAPAPETRPVWEAFARRMLDVLDRTGHDSHVERLPENHPLARALGGPLDCIVVALVQEKRACGLICGLRRASAADFGTSEIRLLRSLSRQLELAIANADLYEDLQQFLMSTVKALVAAIDAKDTYTAGHSERVNIVSMLIGSEMNLDLRELEALYWGSLLHDVGKIGMPEAILNKPTALDDVEVEIMKQHPQRGWEMLRMIERLRGASDGVRDHHERWDGTGYPRALAGEDIPVIARIIAVADTFDALISNRSYRKGRGAPKAVEVIEGESATQFDPAVVAALRRLLPLLDKHQWLLMSGQRNPAKS